MKNLIRKVALVGLFGLSVIYLRNCRLEAEKTSLQDVIYKSNTNKNILVEYIEKNPEQVKNYLPAIVRVAEEKGYLEEMINSISPNKRRSLFLNLAWEETKDIGFGFTKDLSYLVNKEGYVTEYKKELGGKKWACLICIIKEPL